EIWIIEIKSSLTDFQTDKKWPDYLDYCDSFFFAVEPDFPVDRLPAACGLILADPYGAEIIRPAPVSKLAAARRTVITRRVARVGANRLRRLSDPRRPTIP
ncbi:MAG: MmcB family DNA repair protein, partial [Pseudomonadota bacterium]|nr:MmcB family DNA repair protein [Pseudomonadota bacterium]